MMLNENAHEEIKEILKRSFSPVDVELQRNLWPTMLHRLEERERNAPVPWYDWALAGALAATLVFFPSLFLVFAYQL
jgi:hypothetical protein